MQSRLKLIGLAAATALALIAPTSAALAASDGIVLRSGTLRAGPGTDFPSVDQFSRGEEIQIYGCTVDYNWCDVSNDDNRGWFPGSRIGYLEGGRRVVITEAGPSLGLAILGFSVGSYWGQHYYNRPFYGRRDRYEDFHRYGPRPDWNNAPRPQPGWDNRPRPGWDNRPRPEYRPEPPRPEFRPQPQAPRPEFRPQPQAPRPEFRPQPQAPRPEFRPQPQAPRPEFRPPAPQPQIQAPRPQPQIQAPRPQPQPPAPTHGCSRKDCPG